MTDFFANNFLKLLKFLEEKGRNYLIIFSFINPYFFCLKFPLLFIFNLLEEKLLSTLSRIMKFLSLQWPLSAPSPQSYFRTFVEKVTKAERVSDPWGGYTV